MIYFLIAVFCFLINNFIYSFIEKKLKKSREDNNSEKLIGEKIINTLIEEKDLKGIKKDISTNGVSWYNRNNNVLFLNANILTETSIEDITLIFREISFAIQRKWSYKFNFLNLINSLLVIFLFIFAVILSVWSLLNGNGLWNQGTTITLGIFLLLLLIESIVRLCFDLDANIRTKIHLKEKELINKDNSLKINLLLLYKFISSFLNVLIISSLILFVVSMI